MTGERAGLYVHVPFCSAVCPYCDFAVLRDDPAAHERFVAGVLREAELRDAPAEGFDTLYFGGGTPSALGPGRLGELIEGLRTRLNPGRWRVHLEANPEDASPEALRRWRELGVEFLSLGVQSLDDRELRFLGRRHDGAGARAAVEAALDAGFATVSLDLIFGLPGQDAAAWARRVEEAASLGTGHVSCYQLTIHEGTPFHRRRELGRLSELPDETQADLFEIAHRGLEAGGLSAYEVSNFARGPEHRSVHNRKYWRHVPYLGLGPSAHSFLEGRRRSWNRRDLGAWLEALDAGSLPTAGEEILSAEELGTEALMLGLRQPEGLDLAEWSRLYGAATEGASAVAVERWVASGHLVRQGPRLRPTLSGMAVADAIAADVDPRVVD